ncbi:TPA: integrase arm-type DNA-binding domain-containing protein [Vibrio parahaemolyticus]|nr:integrase arm-type DNA-binding domain-containing protein [Vibrio parahaemolyticus]
MPTKVLNKLTAMTVKRAKPEPRKNQHGNSKDNTPVARRISDGGNLYLHVRKSGTKSWEFKFKNCHDKVTYCGLGSYPDVSLQEARDKASECRELIRAGKDPIEDKKAAEEALRNEKLNTFGAFTKVFLNDQAQSDNSDKTFELKEGRIRNYLNPAFSSFPLDKISVKVAVDALQPICKAGKLSLLSKLVELLKQIMDYAVIKGVLTSGHTLHQLHKAFPKPKRKNLPSLPYAELPEYLTKMTAVQMDFITRGLLWFQTHTLTRANEAASARWKDFDFAEMIWVVPGSIMKGKKNISFKVPITKEVREILTQLEPFKDDSGWVFPSNRSKSGHVDSETVNKVITERAGYKGRMCSHGIRSIASTYLNEMEFNHRHVDMCLAHEVKGQVEAAYNNAENVDARRKIMEHWSKHIAEALPIAYKLENYSMK